MKRRSARIALLAGLAALWVTFGTAPGAAVATTGPLYDVKATWGDTFLAPGDANPASAEGQFMIQARNIGDAAGNSDLTITDALPTGVTAAAIHWVAGGTEDYSSYCSGTGTAVVTCVLPAAQVPLLARPPGFHTGLTSASPTGYLPTIYVDVSIDPGASGSGTNVATISGGAAPAPVSDTDSVPFGATPSPFGVVPGSFDAEYFNAAYPFGSPVRQASDHPFEFRLDFDLDAKTGVNEGSEGDSTRYIVSNGQLRTVEVTLPRGMIGNPESVPKCDPVDFSELGAVNGSTACPSNTQVGYLNAQVTQGTHDYGRGGTLANANELSTRVPLYNLVPPKGTPVDIAFNAAGLVQGHIYATLDPANDYAVKSVTPTISNAFGVRGSEVTIWGVPGDPAHNKFRYFSGPHGVDPALGAPWGSAPIRPWWTSPADCGFENGGARIRVDSYNFPEALTPPEEYGEHLNVEGCEDPRFRFEPEVALQPTDRHAGAPTGLDVHLKVPQRNDEVKDASELYAEDGFVKGISTPPIKKAVVTFPPGMTINPAAAQGLGSCSLAQIGISAEGVPNDKPVTCPDSSQYGRLILHTPILPLNAQPEGFVYIAKQNENPNHNFLSLYLAIEEPDRGIRVKLPGRVDLDPETGQITTTFDELPQFPLSDMQMSLKGGLRAGLVNPQTCGQKTIEATFYSWQDPSTPHPVKSSYEITQNPDGSPCHSSLAERPFNPLLSGGTINNLAGSFSPLELMMTRTDEDQELFAAQGSAPPGLLASLRGVGRCSEAQVAAAANPGRTGSEEQASPSCPASSLVGTVDAGAGVGQILTYVKGKIYLAGPYKGAPASGVAIVPAVAGPFDLGVIVTRAPAYIDPETAQLSLKTDPLPLIFKGVPVRVRDIRVHIDRQNFTLNPTSCDPFSLSGTLFSSEGKSKQGGSRFQAADCASLGFAPNLALRLIGGTKRGSHPALRAVVRPRAGDANFGSAVVTLPHSAFLDQAHIRTICTRVQFAAHSCPEGSVYGTAKAVTPLLDEPLSGPVYLRSSSHNLPDLVVALKGPASLPIEFNLAGRVDSVHGGIRSSFEAIPDAPVSEFVLEMQGAKKGLIVNSTNLCASTNRAKANLAGQNGKALTIHPQMKSACGKQRKHKKHKAKRHAKHRRAQG